MPSSVGGGVMGASIAYHLAARGMKKLLLLEREEFFGLGATGRCAGGVRYQFSTEVNVRLSLKSLPMLERFEEELGQAIDYRQCGYLFLMTRPDELPLFQRSQLMQNRLGVNTEWWAGDEIRRRLQMMRLEDVLGGSFNSKDGIVDPNSVVMGYVRAAQRLGATAQTGVSVLGMRVEGAAIHGVDAESSHSIRRGQALRILTST